MSQFVSLLSVFLVAMVEIWISIPMGLSLNIHPFWVAVLSISGAIAGAIVICFAGEKIRMFLLKLKQGQKKKKETLIQKIWLKYGIIGLGLLAPILTGTAFGAVIGITFGAPKAKMILWLSVGAIIWGSILTIAGYPLIEWVESWF